DGAEASGGGVEVAGAVELASGGCAVGVAGGAASGVREVGSAGEATAAGVATTMGCAVLAAPEEHAHSRSSPRSQTAMPCLTARLRRSAAPWRRSRPLPRPRLAGW